MKKLTLIVLLIAAAVSVGTSFDNAEAKRAKPCKYECINHDQYLICRDSVIRHDSLVMVFEDTTLLCTACCY